MFVITTVADTIRLEPQKFSMDTMDAIHEEIDMKYPNRVLYDCGLVISRFGDVLEIGDGMCVPGDGGAHYETVFRLLVFRPFVDEICLGTVLKSTEEGIRVTLGGFFDDIFVPGYWMLRPSHYDRHAKLWVWVPPNYDEEGEGEEQIKDKPDTAGEGGDDDNKEEKEGDDVEERFEVEIGSEIRFRVKALNFTQVTNTAKGLQATTTTTSGGSGLFPGGAGGGDKSQRKRSISAGGGGAEPDSTLDKPVRKRSLSFDLTDDEKLPASFHIVASICEDGLGLTSWWAAAAEEEEEHVSEEGEEEDKTSNGEFEDTC
jgi:DNA-directed RNA polymerase III subunit RPC8